MALQYQINLPHQHKVKIIALFQYGGREQVNQYARSEATNQLY